MPSGLAGAERTFLRRGSPHGTNEVDGVRFGFSRASRAVGPVHGALLTDGRSCATDVSDVRLAAAVVAREPRPLPISTNPPVGSKVGWA